MSCAGFEGIGDAFDRLAEIPCREVAGMILVQLAGRDIDAGIDSLVGGIRDEVADFRIADHEYVATRDEGFFRVRFDRLTPAEKRYLRAMAELGPGPHRSGDIADELSRKVTSLGPTRSQLIAKGMVWSPSHGDTAFTVPLFDEFMKRIMPDDDWRMA